MTTFPCPYLRAEVELTEERERHIMEQHPDLLPEHRERIMLTEADPDEVRPDPEAANTRLFVRWFHDLRAGKHVAVVVVTDARPVARHWIVTAYVARRLAKGEAEWRRS